MNISSWDNLPEDIFYSVIPKLSTWDLGRFAVVCRSWKELSGGATVWKNLYNTARFCSLLFNPRTNEYIFYELLPSPDWKLIKEKFFECEKDNQFVRFTKIFLGLVRKSVEHSKDIKDLALLDALSMPSLKKDIILDLKPKLKPSFAGDIALAVIEDNPKFYEYERIYNITDYYFYDYKVGYSEQDRYFELKDRIEAFRDNSYQKMEAPLLSRFICDLVAQKRYEEALERLHIPDHQNDATKNVIFYFLYSSPKEFHERLIEKLVESDAPYFKCQVSLLAAYDYDLLDKFYDRVTAFKEFENIKKETYTRLIYAARAKGDDTLINKLIRVVDDEELISKMVGYLSNYRPDLLKEVIAEGLEKAFDDIFCYCLIYKNPVVLEKLIAHPKFKINESVVTSCCRRGRLDLIIPDKKEFVDQFIVHWLAKEDSPSILAEVPEPYHTIITLIGDGKPSSLLGTFINMKYFEEHLALKKRELGSAYLKQVLDSFWEGTFKGKVNFNKISNIYTGTTLTEEVIIDVAFVRVICGKVCFFEYDNNLNKISVDKQKYILKLLYIFQRVKIESKQLFKDIDAYFRTLSEESLEDFKLLLKNNPLRKHSFTLADQVIERIESYQKGCTIS